MYIYIYIYTLSPRRPRFARACATPARPRDPSRGKLFYTLVLLLCLLSLLLVVMLVLLIFVLLLLLLVVVVEEYTPEITKMKFHWNMTLKVPWGIPVKSTGQVRILWEIPLESEIPLGNATDYPLENATDNPRLFLRC